jgi:hypothetical protein
MKTNFKNFESAIMSAKNADELKKTANEAIASIKSAYDKRLAEIVSAMKVAEAAKKTAKAAPKKAAKASEKKVEKAAKKAAEKKPNTLTLDGQAVEQIALTDTKALKKLGLKFIPYSEKCLIIGGNTKPIHKALKAMKSKGVFGNMHLKAVKGFEGGFGWLVNKENKNYKSVCKALNLKAV